MTGILQKRQIWYTGQVTLKYQEKEQQKQEDIMSIPKDPVMLLSYVNTQLRDHYKSLEELCRERQIEQEELCQRLKEIDYCYDRENNQFR